MRGCVWKLSSGIVPFVDVSHFLDFRPPKSAVVTRMPEYSFTELAEEPSFHTQVDFVLNPKPYYANSLESVFEDPAVERNLDRMFSLEAVGITENTLSSWKSRSLKILFPFRMDLTILTSLWMRKKWIWSPLTMWFLWRCWIEWVTL